MSERPRHWWVVVNALARGPRRDARLRHRLEQAVGSHGHVSMPEGLEALHEAAREARAARADGVAIVGGDGTAHRVATAVLLDAWKGVPEHELPAFALPGGGTMNTIARGLGLRPGRPERVLRALVSGPLREVRQAPVIVDHTYAGWLFGIGITPRFIEAYEAGGTPSPTRAALTLGRAVVGVVTGGPFADRFFERIPATLHVDGTPAAEGGWLIVMAGAAPSVGLDFRPFPPSHDPRTFGIFGTRSTPAQLAADLVLIRQHKPVPRDSAFSARARSFVIEAQAPLHLQLDGDLWAGGTSCEVRSGPILRMVAPA